MTRKKIWITGAGRGIGREAALLFARKGWQPWISSRSGEELDEVGRLCEEGGGGAVPLPLDVRSAEDVAAAIGRIEEDGKPLDALFPSAGVGSFSTVAETDPAEWDRIIATNLTGVFLSLRAAIPGMIRAGSGKIILISSVAARLAFPAASAYSASKAGVVALAGSAREELRGTGVRVSLIVPGAVASPFWDTIESDLDRSRMLPARMVAEAALRLAEERAEGTTEELILMPPEGVL